MDKTPDPNDPFADAPENAPVSPHDDPFGSGEYGAAGGPAPDAHSPTPVGSATERSGPADNEEGAREGRTERGAPKPRHRGRRSRQPTSRLVLIGLAGVLVLLLIDGLWVTYSVESGLQGARGSLEVGAQATREGRFDEAASAFAEAEDSASTASGAMGHPSAQLVAQLPLVGDDAAAIEALAKTTQLTARAGVAIADAASEAGLSAGQGSLLRDGRIDLESVETAAAGLSEASSLLDEAMDEVNAIDTDGLIEPVRQPVASARTQLSELTSTADRAVETANLLTPMLGKDERRKYLVVMMSLADPRGSGGYPGEYGVLSVQEGKMDLAPMKPMGNLGSVPPVSSVRQDQLRYLRWGGNTHFIASTYSPDFPTTGRTIAAMWGARGMPPIDGVIGVDAVWVANLLATMAPVEIKGHEGTVTSANATDVLIREPYLFLDQEKSNALQAKLGTGLLEAILKGSPDSAGLVTAMSKSVAERHLQVYLVDKDEEKALMDLDAAGEYELGENPLAVAWQGAAPQRTGFFAQRAVHYEATIGEDGSVEVVTDVRVHNGAPDSPPSILLGDGKFYPVGFNSVYVNLYLPEDAEKMTTEVIGGPGLQLFEREFYHPVILQYLGMDPGQSTTARFSYTIPPPSDPADSFEVTITPQPSLRPDHVTLDIITPTGTVASSSTPGSEVEGPQLSWEGDPITPTKVEVEY